jgi:hypothetical protein
VLEGNGLRLLGTLIVDQSGHHSHMVTIAIVRSGKTNGGRSTSEGSYLVSWFRTEPFLHLPIEKHVSAPHEVPSKAILAETDFVNMITVRSMAIIDQMLRYVAILEPLLPSRVPFS